MKARTIAAATLALLPLLTAPRADAATLSAGDWLACEATAVVFKNLLDLWEKEGRGSAEPASTNVESLRVGLSIAAVYVSIGPDVQPGDPRLEGMREEVVSARAAASAAVERDLGDKGLDATFAAVSRELRVCGEALGALEADIKAGTFER